MKLEALIWDVDGTLAETEAEGHRVAFNLAFQALGLPWHWDHARYGRLLAVTGGRERLLHDMQTRPDAPLQAEVRESLARALHARKNAFYAERVAAGLVRLRPGVAELLAECRERGLRLAIATTTSRDNVEALLRATMDADTAAAFEARVCGEDVQAKKPDPEAHRLALAALGLQPGQALALEDAPAGLQAARAAGLPTVVTLSRYFPGPPGPGALAVGPGLDRREGWRPAAAPGSGRLCLDDLIAWHGREMRAAA